MHSVKIILQRPLNYKINTMRRIFVLTALSICMFGHAMAHNALTHDTITIQTKSPSLLTKEKPEKKFIKPEAFGFKVKNLNVPKDFYNFITDDSCENICFLSEDTTAANTNKKKKKQSILMTVKRISDDSLIYRKTFPWKGQKYILSKTSLTELLFNNTTITDFATTAQLFQQKSVHSYLGYVNDNLLLCTHNNITDAAKITAYSMTTGQELWQTKKILNVNYGMTYCQPIDDVSDYVVSGDLIRVNWETGDIKKLDCKTSITNKKSVLATALIGVAAGVAGGLMGAPMMYIPVERPASNYNRSFFFMPSSLRIAGLNSDIIQHSGKNYFADRNTLHCFDNDMNETWNVELPEKGTRSELFLQGDTICMVNLALGIYGNGGVKAMEKPYVATFSATDGKLFSYQPIEMEKQNVISCISFENQLHLLFPNREAIYNTTSNKMDIVDTDTTLIGSFRYYVGDGQLYKLNSDNSFSEIKPTENTMPIRTNNGYVVDVKNGKPTVLATPSEAFRTIASHNDMIFILGQRTNFMELWLLKNGEAALINDRINSVRTKHRHLILSLDNGKIQVVSY